MVLLPFKGLFYEALGATNNQMGDTDGRKHPCANIELNAAECLEAYGVSKGNVMCKKFAEDMTECQMNTIEVLRQKLMRIERTKKIVSGEIPWEKRKGEPYNYASYITGTFYP